MDNATKTYEKAYLENVKRFQELFESEGGATLGKEELWEAVNGFYDDPDAYALRTLDGIECSADALFSWKRIYAHEGWDESFIETYKEYRKVPVVFFPREWNGINMSRYAPFGDRIDHTFLDLKNYFAGKDDVRMGTAYELPKTKQWLGALGSFENLVDWAGVKGVITNDNYEVYDLEAGNGAILHEYWMPEQYAAEWSDAYYQENKKVYKALETKILFKNS